ncbi:MAG: hypothetical protein ACM3ZO_02135 [Clostridia bacterium]
MPEERAARLLGTCVVVLVLVTALPAAAAGNAGKADGTRSGRHAHYEGVSASPGRVVVRGEGSPLLYIGGTLGITAEVFLGDIPAGPGDPAGSGGADAGADPGAGPGADPATDPGAGAGEPANGSGEAFLPPRPSGITLPGIRQDLDLMVDARFGESIQAFARLSMQGFWGVASPSDASPWMPAVARPLLVDEAWARYSGRDFQVCAGKRRFSLGPIGLLGRTDLEAPEGIYADAAAHGLALTGVWARLSSGYYYNSSFVTRADDLFALRVEKHWEHAAVAWNYLASGLGDESGHSLDVSVDVLGRAVAAEVALFRSSSTLYPEFRTDGWVPAVAVRAELANTPVHRLTLSYARIAQGFAPYYSSVASRSGGQGLPFDQNTEGLAAGYDRRVSGDTEISAGVAWLRFIDEAVARGEASGDEEQDGSLTQAEITPALTASVRLTKELSPNTSARAWYEHWWTESGRSYGRLTAGLAVNF